MRFLNIMIAHTLLRLPTAAANAVLKSSGVTGFEGGPALMFSDDMTPDSAVRSSSAVNVCTEHMIIHERYSLLQVRRLTA